MEVLSYSLWFTLVWWIYVCYESIKILKMIHKAGLEIKFETGKFVLFMILLPIIAILLEYLI